MFLTFFFDWCINKKGMIDFGKSSITTRGKQHFYLNSTEVSGVQSASISYKIPKTPIRYIGVEEVDFAANGSTQADIQVESFVVGKDYFIEHTGESPFNGYVLKDKNNSAENFSFRSGFLTSHVVRCSIGELPSTQSSITAFGGAGRIDTTDSLVSGHLTSIASGPADTSRLNFISAGSIEVELNDLKSNRINSFEISYNTERQPIYGLGNKDPKHVFLKYPIPVECKFNIDVMENGYVAYNSTGYPCNDRTGSLRIKLNDMYSDSLVENYDLGNVHLVQESHVSNTNGPTTMDLVYKGFLKRPN